MTTKSTRKTFGLMLRVSVLVSLFWLPRLFAMPERNVSFDFGTGPPQLFFLQAQVVISQSFQGGVGYSIVPNSVLFGSGFDLPEQEVTLTSALGAEELFTITPRVKPSLSIITPFLRYYPTERNFYIQLSYPMYIINANISGSLRPTSGNTNLVSMISSNVKLTQPLPTISIGHVFSGKLYFFNLSIGASFFASIQSSVTIDGAFADAVENSAENQAALDQLSQQFEDKINNSATEFKRQLFLVPSINMTWGIML